MLSSFGRRPFRASSSPRCSEVATVDLRYVGSQIQSAGSSWLDARGHVVWRRENSLLRTS